MRPFLFSGLTNWEFQKYGLLVNRKGTTMRADFETRSLMVLQEEVARVTAAAERVRLVVQAMAQRRGIARAELVRDAGYDFGGDQRR
jgi:hypothetical protein